MWHNGKIPQLVSWLVDFYVMASSKVISRRVQTYGHIDSSHPWRLYNAVPLGNQITCTRIRYPTLSHYPDNDPTSPCPMLIILSAWLGRDKYQYLSHYLTRPRIKLPNFRTRARPTLYPLATTFVI